MIPRGGSKLFCFRQGSKTTAMCAKRTARGGLRKTFRKKSLFVGDPCQQAGKVLFLIGREYATRMAYWAEMPLALSVVEAFNEVKIDFI
ncbi:MAG: hypothetical protein HYW90_04870 [Candidatus Sungbacteria bacterium]|nr:hypothetical protein [Candidatus Sungbacteria bacterium]